MKKLEFEFLLARFGSVQLASRILSFLFMSHRGSLETHKHETTFFPCSSFNSASAWKTDKTWADAHLSPVHRYAMINYRVQRVIKLPANNSSTLHLFHYLASFDVSFTNNAFHQDVVLGSIFSLWLAEVIWINHFENDVWMRDYSEGLIFFFIFYLIFLIFTYLLYLFISLYGDNTPWIVSNLYRTFGDKSSLEFFKKQSWIFKVSHEHNDYSTWTFYFTYFRKEKSFLYIYFKVT